MSSSPEKRREYAKRYRDKPSSREKRKAYAARTREKRKTYMKDYFSNPKNRARRRVYQATRRHLTRAGELRREYGITQEHYDLLLRNQGGRCAICGTDKPEDSIGRGFHVDHDRLLGEVRGLLCGKCNWGLGLFSDDVDRLMQACVYLRGKRLVDQIVDETRRRSEEP